MGNVIAPTTLPSGSGFGEVLSGLGGLIPGIGGLVSGIGNLVSQNAQFDYNKQMQQKTWDREDTAVQRRADDLEAAGLSKTLAAGGAAQTMAPISNAVPNVGESVDKSLNGAAMGMALLRQKVDISKTIADTKSTELQNKFLSDSMSNRLGTVATELANKILEGKSKTLGLSETEKDIASKALANEIKNYNYQFFRDLGLPENAGMDRDLRLGAIAKHAVLDVLGSKPDPKFPDRKLDQPQLKTPKAGKKMEDYMSGK
nr:MAG: hypothetical protein [Microviridae sp.]